MVPMAGQLGAGWTRPGQSSQRSARGAKTLFLTLYAFVLYHMLSGDLPPSSYDAPLKLGSLVVQHALQVAACGLLLLSLQKPTDAELIAEAARRQ